MKPLGQPTLQSFSTEAQRHGVTERKKRMKLVPSRSLPLIYSSVSLRLFAFALIHAILTLPIPLPSRTAIAGGPNRSPVDLVLGPSDAWIATVNQTSDSVSLVRTSDGRVLDEVAVGHHPAAIALAPDGKTLLVSGHYSGDITLLEVTGEKLANRRTIDVGYQPHGVAISPDGK